MVSGSGLVGALVNVKENQASGDFALSAEVRGGLASNFDAELSVSRRDALSEFDAKVCIQLSAEERVPTAQIQLPTTANSSGLPPFLVTFSGVGLPSGGRDIVQYRWFFNDVTTTASGGQTTTHSFGSSGSFLVTLRVMDSEGFMGFDTIRINTFSGVSIDLPGLSISGVPQVGKVPNFSVDFGASGNPVAGTTILGYGWNFGHGKFSKRQNPSGITYKVPGVYTPVCTVVDSRGFKMADSLEIGANN